MAEWTFADGRKLTFTGEFGGEYKSAVRLGPREQWDEYPVRGNPWPEPEADYEALGYPETEVGFESPSQAALNQIMVSMLHQCISVNAQVGLPSIMNNQDDVDMG